MNKKILLLNLPGQQLYVRDYFCSKVSKADYINAPIDLVMLSGILNDNGNQISLIDAIVERLDESEVILKIRSLSPDIIIGLTGSVSLSEDKVFLEKLATQQSGKIFLIGDFLLTEGKKFLSENKYISGVVLNFVSPGVKKYFNGDIEGITDMIVRSGEEIVQYPTSSLEEFSIGRPLQSEFVKLKYRMPFVRSFPFATTIMSYACPFKCTFCVMNTIHFSRRNIDDLFLELDQLKLLGTKEILFLDQTLGIDRDRFKVILNRMIDKKYDFSWFGFSRVDIVDDELLILMKKAGCHTLWFGVESSSDQTLALYKKGYTRKQIEQAFAATKRVGIKTLATFIIGLPEEDFNMIQDTINFSRQLSPDFASFNFAVPRFGTELRHQAIDSNLIAESTNVMDQSGSSIVMGTKTLSKAQIKQLKRNAILGFYLRPKYIAQRLTSLTSWTEFKMNVRNFVSLIKNEL